MPPTPTLAAFDATAALAADDTEKGKLGRKLTPINVGYIACFAPFLI
jgi:hypothetical protein